MILSKNLVFYFLVMNIKKDRKGKDGNITVASVGKKESAEIAMRN